MTGSITTQIFDGTALAAQRQLSLTKQVQELKDRGAQLQIGAIVFAEDVGSVLYTGLKQAAAQQVGIGYQVRTFSLSDASEAVVKAIHEYNRIPVITGIIVQKPWRKTWQEATLVDGEPKAIRQAFNTWWQYLTSQIDLNKDVDGLHPESLAAVQADTWQQQGRVLPATAQAIVSILKQVPGLPQPEQLKAVVLGKSDIVGKPIFYWLQNARYQAEMIGSRELLQRKQSGRNLSDADIIISATGREHLITGELIKPGSVVIDVGEPRPDVDQASVTGKARFITPVPGGVGPVTVVSLLENAVELVV